MTCQICGRVMDSNEPVHRIRVAGHSPFVSLFRGLIGSICIGCSTQKFEGTKWREPQPCAHCGRPVSNETWRKEPWNIVCGKTCRIAIFNAQARQRRALAPRACEKCGQSFAPKRTDSRFCSVACKQSAYRRRNRVANATATPGRTR
jgi:hypothetical protein